MSKEDVERYYIDPVIKEKGNRVMKLELNSHAESVAIIIATVIGLLGITAALYFSAVLGDEAEMFTECVKRFSPVECR